MAKVLYIEDHPAQRDILAQMLELNGFEVATASDGLEGVELDVLLRCTALRRNGLIEHDWPDHGSVTRARITPFRAIEE